MYSICRVQQYLKVESYLLVQQYLKVESYLLGI